MRRLAWPEVSPPQLLEYLCRMAPVWGPRVGRDGVVCWGRITAWNELVGPEQLPLLPLKRWLLPSPERLWTEGDQGFIAEDGGDATILVGISPCDLSALHWLDQAHAEDSAYRRRRQQLRLVGRSCRPSPQCSCPPQTELPPFDLFIDERWLWSASAWGNAVLAALDGGPGVSTTDIPETCAAGTAVPWPADLAARFQAGQQAAVWLATAARCLSCGACSAVCPTCTCFDLFDLAPLAAPVRRQRVADNCFFRDHALVAGGLNFRPDRAARLKFRFEHKLLGFGALRGQVSCVGCGRCVRVCPARIDLREVLAALPPAAVGGV